MADDPYLAHSSPAPSSDDPYLAHSSPVDASASNAVEPQRARAALNGLTFGLGPRVIAAGRSIGGEKYGDALNDEYDKLNAYRKDSPWSAAGYEAAGSLPTMLIPGVGQVGNAARIGRAVEATTPALRAAAGVGSVGAEVGRGGAQLGAVQGALHSRDYTDPGQVAKDAATGGAAGYIGGRVINGVAQPVVNAVGNAREAVAIGSNARAAGLRTLRQSVDEQGTDLGEAARSFLPQDMPQTMTPEAQQAVHTTYAREIANGASELDARNTAITAYQATNPLNNKGNQLGDATATDHVRDQITGYAAQNRVPLIAAEVLSGADQPITGEMKNLTQSLMNNGGEASRVLQEAATSRQAGAIPRTRDLIDETIAGGIPGGGRDYIGAMQHIEDASRQARNAAYGQARTRARSFDIEPVLERFRGIADENAGVPRTEILNAVDGMQDWYTRMTSRLADLDPSQRGVGDNQILLNSYRQARSGLTDQIGTLGRAGNREAAGHLQMLKTEMDDIVRRRNPAWWRANNGTAETYRVQEAADQGRTTPTDEGAPVQQLKYDMANTMTIPQREAARLGMARQFQDKVSRLGDDHDVAKIFMKGGEGQDQEGTRGLVTSLIGHARDDAQSTARSAAEAEGRTTRTVQSRGNAARDAVPTSQDFYQQMQREETARRTFQLDKGSQTNALQEGTKRRNAFLGAAMALIHNPNPMAIVSALGNLALQKASAARDAEIARMLATSTDRPDQLLGLINELARTTAQTRDAFTPMVSRELAEVTPTVAKNLGDKTTNTPGRGMAAPFDARRRGMGLTQPSR